MIKIKLANIPIQLNNRFLDTEILCRGFETEEMPRIVLQVTQQDIEEERQSQSEEYSDGYLESICFYRKLAIELLNWDIFLLHASVVEVDGKGYAFLAHSGTGKTTQTRLWLQHFGDHAKVVNGDKPLVRVLHDPEGYRFMAYGTPWCGKEGMGCNASVQLYSLFLLERSVIPNCEPASQEYCVDRLFHQLLMPRQPEQMERLLTMADQLVETVPSFVLRCDMTEASVIAAFEASNRD